MRATGMQTVINALDALSDWIGRTLCWLTLAMMVITCLVVILRYGFDQGSIALQESVMYLHGCVFMLGIAYALRHRAHVRVDIIYERSSPRWRALVDTLGTLFFLFPFALFLLYSSFGYVSQSWSLAESSAQPGGLPGVFVLKTLIPVMASLLLLQGVAELLRSLSVLLTRSR